MGNFTGYLFFLSFFSLLVSICVYLGVILYAGYDCFFCFFAPKWLVGKELLVRGHRTDISYGQMVCYSIVFFLRVNLW